MPWRRRERYVWPPGTPFTARRALSEIAWLVAREWSPLLLVAAGGAVAGVCPPRTPALAAAVVALVAVEEYAHLAATLRLWPPALGEPRLSLAVTRPFHVAARVSPPLPPRDAAAAALAGPLAAALAGALTLTLPALAAGLYPPAIPGCLPLFYLAASALPLPGTDAAVVGAVLRARGRDGAGERGTRAAARLLNRGFRLACSVWLAPPTFASARPEASEGRPHVRRE